MMKNFDLIQNETDFSVNYEDKNIKKMAKIYSELAYNFETLLETLNDNNYIDINEFKEYLNTKYSYSNFDSFLQIIEEYQKYWASNLPYKNIEF